MKGRIVYRVATLTYQFALTLLVGFMAVAQWALVPAQNRLDASGYATLEQGMNHVMQRLTPSLMIAALVAGALAAAFGWQRGRVPRLLLCATLVCLVAMIVSTLTINAPINSAIDAWSAQAPPADWIALRDRWEAGHAFRSYVGLIGLAAALVVGVWDRDAERAR